MPRLDAEEIADRLLRHPEWEAQGAGIRRQFTFRSFREAMVFVNRVASLAESADHHPDILVRWNKVTLDLTTHSAGGLTQADFLLAREIDLLLPTLAP